AGGSAERIHNGYRHPRCLLRGLRDWRPRRLRRADPPARAIQGSHPHQAGAGDRGPSAARASDPGASEGTACLMHDRRADVARSLGELARSSEALLLPQFEVSLALESGKIDARDAGYMDIIER